DFLRIARQARLIEDAIVRRSVVVMRRFLARQVERRVPEGFPFVTLEDLRSDLHPQAGQRIELLIGDAAKSGDQAEIRGQTGGENGPCSGLVTDRELADFRRAVLNPEKEAQFTIVLASPGNGQRLG